MPFNDPNEFSFKLNGYTPTATSPGGPAPAPMPQAPQQAAPQANYGGYAGPSAQMQAPPQAPQQMPMNGGQPMDFKAWGSQFFKPGERFHKPTAMKAYQDYIDNFYRTGGQNGGMTPFQAYQVYRDAMRDGRSEQNRAEDVGWREHRANVSDQQFGVTSTQGQARINQSDQQFNTRMGFDSSKFNFEQWKERQDSSRAEMKAYVDALETQRTELRHRLDDPNFRLVTGNKNPEVVNEIQKRLDETVQKLDAAYKAMGDRALDGGKDWQQSPQQPGANPARTQGAPGAQQPAAPAPGGDETVEIIWKPTGQRLRGRRADLSQYQEGVDYDVAQ